MKRSIVFVLCVLSLQTACQRSAPHADTQPSAEPSSAPSKPAQADLPAAPMQAMAAATDPAQLLRGELPQHPEIAVLRARCESCHTLEYVTQQRLSEGQWAKSLTKMQLWGSTLTDQEKATLGPYLASVWPKTLPDRISPLVAAPEGAVHIGR